MNVWTALLSVLGLAAAAVGLGLVLARRAGGEACGHCGGGLCGCGRKEENS